ncbi:MAG: hypothetical protein LQ346_000086 [Caloplaca aetnensis]|nr:MAG: hypothetical protein LQ346_000086 [Caloplaca aetnensis]
MNSLNLLSSRVVGQAPLEKPGNYRRRSFSDGSLGKVNEKAPPRRSVSQHVKQESSTETLREKDTLESDGDGEKFRSVVTDPRGLDVNEKSRLIHQDATESKPDPKSHKLHLAARRLVKAFVGSIRFVLSTLAYPGVYVAGYFYDDSGLFAPLRPGRTLSHVLSGRGGQKSTAQAVGLSASAHPEENARSPARPTTGGRRITGAKNKAKKPSPTGAPPFAASESDSDVRAAGGASRASTEDMVMSQLSSSSDESTPVRRSIRIKLYNEDSARKRKSKKSPPTASSSVASTISRNKEPPLTVATIKSPTSPASSLRMSKYPRASAPPRPLIPPRQPSYSSRNPSRSSTSRLGQKTLVIDLDETLIHSLAKGGRMSSGHMVEVKLNTTVGYGGTTLGPQHPILYYVHKRPHCDEFLRKVCNWYELVVFTASVQEYADPVIDWLEQERKYFTRRYYRQHCTFRNGAYVKDLSSVEPDLSKVMIIDNSPLSYIFHEDNAIPIEGWINDPTDNDLLHLVPILEALQYVIDVRALLALRRGEIETPR